MQREAAETLALRALAWVVASDDLLPVFLGASGTSEGDLKSRVQDIEFLASVLDFLLMDDAWVTAFCDACGHAYQAPAQARAALPGGTMTHWT